MTHEHRFGLAGWSVWRSVCIRGAGFPVSAVRSLAAPLTCRALDRLDAGDTALAAARDAAIAALDEVLATETARESRKPLVKCIKQVRGGGAPANVGHAAVDARLAVLRAAKEACDRERAAAQVALLADRRRLGEQLRAQAADPRFREALVWQNRTAVHTALDVLARTPLETWNTKVRQHEQLVVSYLQRYAVKNDTIGFFGPIAWATLGDELRVQPGPSHVRARATYFEFWGMHALAQTIAADPELRAALVPCKLPSVRLAGDRLHFPIDRSSQLPHEYAVVLAACDGERDARTIAAALLADEALGLTSEEEVFGLIEELVDQRAASWTIAIPPHVEHPERFLDDTLAAIAADDHRARLGELVAARDAVAAAAGDPAALDAAFARLEDTFARLTDTPAVRRAGQTYAGRTLVFEDCVRDVDLTLPAAIFDRIAAPLSIMLAVARWFTHTLVESYRRTFVELHAELAATAGPEVDYLRFWERATSHFVSDGETPPLIARAVTELQTRWAEVVGLEDARRIERSAVALAERVAARFAAPGPGWPSARHHSPDLMLAAAGEDALRRGDYLVVMGELHVAMSTFAPWLTRHHAAREELARTVAAERGVPIVEPVFPVERVSRPDNYSIAPTDFDLELGAARSWRPREQVLEVASLYVVRDGDSIAIRSRDGVHDLAFEQVFDWFLTNHSVSHFKLVPPRAHVPRVTIDTLVVQRETWRFEATDLAFAHVEDPLDRLRATRQWARDRGIPQHAFYKVPHETKPCYLDLESPHLVDQLASQARRATSLVVSEMLPALDELWLSDRDRARYTSELRVVCTDPVAWRRGQ